MRGEVVLDACAVAVDAYVLHRARAGRVVAVAIHAREKEASRRFPGRAEQQPRLALGRRVPRDAVAGALREPANPVGLQATGFHAYAAGIVIDFDHGALAQEAFDAAVQVSKIVHAARMPRARERGT